MLIVHGYSQHVHMYDPVAAVFNADGASVYAVDHMGHGRSEGERAVFDDIEKIVDDVHLLAERARAEVPQVPVVVVAHSMGGLIGSRYLQRYPDELACGVLSAPALTTDGIIDTLLAQPEILDVPLDLSTLSRDPAVGEAHGADPLVYHGPFRRQLLEAVKAGTQTLADGGRFAVPVLWIQGEDDQIVRFEYNRPAWATLEGAGAQARSYPGARHELFFETNKEEVLGDVLAFIDAHV